MHLIKSTVLFIALLLCNNVLATTKNTISTLSLQNLERERAAFVDDLLNLKLDGLQRQQRIVKRQRSLSDMERMVMRDERLLRSDSALVENAFSQYESTFLVHAGAENNISAAQQWLLNIKLSNQAIMNTQSGYRK